MIEPHAESATLRQMMVDCQIRTFDVTELRLIARFLDVPREPFVPAAAVDIAYSDHAIALGGGRKLLPPLVLARMIQEAEVDAGARVLDVGCATGYSTAILAGMAASVVAVESDAALAAQARSALASARIAGVTIVEGELADGAATNGPYDVIIVNGAVEEAPSSLLAQLSKSGRLIAILQPAGVAGQAVRFQTHGHRPLFAASAPLLAGFARAPAFIF